MAVIRGGSRAIAEGWKAGDLIVAVELGSGAGKSTGFFHNGGLTQPENLDSATAAGRAGQVILNRLKDQDSTAALIIEAPLSYCWKKGLPTGRCSSVDGGIIPLETRLQDGRRQHRYWYEGAGAAVALAAMFFVRTLSQMTAASSGQLFLFEGFATFKGPGQGDHASEARFFVEHLGNAVDLAVPQGGTGRSVIDFLGIAADPALPAIIDAYPPTA